MVFYCVCETFPLKYIINQTESVIEEFNLSKDNQEGYLKLRKHYNEGDKNWKYFYTLVAHSFSNQIRFNNRKEFNMPFGKRTFNSVMKDNLIKFVESIKNKNIEFANLDFKEFNINELTKNDFIFCDPPYLITCASYNENGGWKEKDEIDLLNLLDKLYDKGIRFALSNVLESKGNSNDILKKWVKDKGYNIHKLNVKYGNANYQRKDKSDSTTLEVLITNY